MRLHWNWVCLSVAAALFLGLLLGLLAGIALYAFAGDALYQFGFTAIPGKHYARYEDNNFTCLAFSLPEFNGYICAKATGNLDQQAQGFVDCLGAPWDLEICEEEAIAKFWRGAQPKTICTGGECE